MSRQNARLDSSAFFPHPPGKDVFFLQLFLNLLISYPQDVQQIGKGDRFRNGASPFTFFGFCSQSKIRRLFGLPPVSDLVLRRIHELQDDCCCFGNRRRAGVCAGSSA